MDIDKQIIKKDNKCNSLGHVFNDNTCKYCGKTLQELYTLKEEQNKTEKPKEVILYGLDVGDYHQVIYGIFSTKQKLMEGVRYLNLSKYEYNIVKFKIDPLDPHFADNMNEYIIHISKDGIIKNIRIGNDFPEEDCFGFSFRRDGSEDLYYDFWDLDEEQAIKKIDKLRLILLDKNLWSYKSFIRVENERNIERKQLIKEILDILNNSE